LFNKSHAVAAAGAIAATKRTRWEGRISMRTSLARSQDTRRL
jgi:hypothetical protein